MVYLGELNSRMKDFYDLYRLLQPGKFDEVVLMQAISEKFKTRKSSLSADIAVFSPAFSDDESRKRLWRSFLAKSRLDEIPLEEVVSHIRTVLVPLIDEIRRDA